MIQEAVPNNFVDTSVTKRYNKPVSPKRGEIYLVDFDGIGSEQKGKRPAVVVQNDVGNEKSTTVIVAPMTSRLSKHNIPTHVQLSRERTSLKTDSIVLMEQMRVVDKSRLTYHVATVNTEDMKLINNALLVSLGLI